MEKIELFLMLAQNPLIQLTPPDPDENGRTVSRSVISLIDLIHILSLVIQRTDKANVEINVVQGF